MHRAPLLQAIARYAARHPDEEAVPARFAAFVRAHPRFLAWVPWNRLAACTTEESILRMAAKSQGLACSIASGES